MIHGFILNRFGKSTFFIFLTALLTVAADTASAESAAKPSFDVASIKPVETCMQKFPSGIMFDPPSFQGGRYRGCNNLKRFMEEAYETELRMIEGGPDWAGGGDPFGGASYQIEAKADPSTSKHQMHLMLQSLLEERFKLKIRRTHKEMQVYILSVAKDGPKLLPAKLDESGKPVAASSDKSSEYIGRPERMKGKRDWRLFPQLFGYGDTADGQWEFMCTAVPVSRFAGDFLSNPNVTGKKVVDKTGIPGLYDFYVKYSGVKANPKNDNAVPEPSGPSIFKAVQDQLGLKLEPAKETFEFIVIDGAEKPSEN